MSRIPSLKEIGPYMTRQFCNEVDHALGRTSFKEYLARRREIISAAQRTLPQYEGDVIEGFFVSGDDNSETFGEFKARKLAERIRKADSNR